MTTIHEWMQTNRVKQAQLARDLGVSESHVSDLLHQKKRPSLTLAAQIEDYTRGKVKMRSWVPQAADA